MSAWLYRKPEATHIQGICVFCKKNKQKKTSKGTYQALCSWCDEKRFGIRKRKQFYVYRCNGERIYRKFKEECCSRCGFIAENRCQLDVHHIDQNHHNNDPNNLITLCANCHRLIHRQETTPD